MSIEFTNTKLLRLMIGILSDNRIPGCMVCGQGVLDHQSCRAYLTALREHLSEDEVFYFFYIAHRECTRLAFIWHDFMVSLVCEKAKRLDDLVWFRMKFWGVGFPGPENSKTTSGDLLARELDTCFSHQAESQKVIEAIMQELSSQDSNLADSSNTPTMVYRQVVSKK